jgi:hypothetical protein
LSIRGDKLESELHVYYKWFVILYADDTVILSESKDGLQKSFKKIEMRKRYKFSPSPTPVRQGGKSD